MSIYKNPFEKGSDRHAIWEMLVERDIAAFLASDWDAVADDFIEEGFMGVDGRHLSNPDSWRLSFPNLASYKETWIAQAKEFNTKAWSTDPKEGLHLATTLRDIEVVGDAALLHKKFDGKLVDAAGEITYLNWQTLYRCRKVDGQWKIAGFTGYLPHPLGGGNQATPLPGKVEPEGASQHVTAGPYAPVLQINPGQLIVISGQAAINRAGEIIGETVEEQTHLTLENCQTQLQSAGASLDDVFKVNIFVKDLDHWGRINEVYRGYFKEPRPVRTAVQTGLLSTLLVEIEMWAVKK